MLRYRSPAWLVSVPASGLLLLACATPAHADVWTAGSAFKPMAVALKTSAASKKTVTAPKDITSVSIIARGTSCSKVAPKLAVKVDSKTIATVKVGSKATKYVINTPVAPGSHTLSLQLTNATPNASCVRTVRVDNVVLNSKKVDPSPSAPVAAARTAPITAAVPVVIVPVAPVDTTPVDVPVDTTPIDVPVDSTPIDQPVDSTPIDEPVDTTPADTTPIDEPVDTTPADTTPIDVPIDPTTPAPVDPTPTTPAPVDPTPTTPAPVDPTTPVVSTPAASTPAATTPPAPSFFDPFEAESLSISPSTQGKVFTDGDASDGSAQLIWNNGSISKTVNAGITNIGARVKGDQCEGAPKMTLSVDGYVYSTTDVSWTGWATKRLTLPEALEPGSHTVTVAFINNATVSQDCDRNLRVDWLGVNLAARYTDTTPAPVPTTPVASTPKPSTPAASTPKPSTPVASTPKPSTPAATTPKASTPVTTPGTTVPGPTRPKLKWPAPAMNNPTTLNLNANFETVTLDTTKDYILKLPKDKPKNGMTVRGGHNVIIIGGQINLTGGAALYIDGATGTFHVEGLLIDEKGFPEGDGITIRAPKAIVQIENSRVLNINGSQNGVHGDIIQAWGGTVALRVDRFTGSTGCQGLFLRPDIAPNLKIELSHVDLNYNNNAINEGGDLIFLTTGCTAYPVTMDEVYLGTPQSGLTSASSAYPKPWTANCPSKAVGNQVTWPSLPITGHATTGKPAGGEFVPNGAAGIGYTSPGYLS